MDSKVSDKIGRVGIIDGGDYPMQAACRPRAAPPVQPHVQIPCSPPAGTGTVRRASPRTILSLSASIRLPFRLQPPLRICPFDAAQRCA